MYLHFKTLPFIGQLAMDVADQILPVFREPSVSIIN